MPISLSFGAICSANGGALCFGNNTIGAAVLLSCLISCSVKSVSTFKLGAITAKGLLGRRLRSRNNCTATGLAASHAR